MEYLNIKVQSHEDRLWRLNRLCGIIGYTDAVKDYLLLSDKELSYHIKAIYDHKGCLDILWDNYDPRISLVITDAWADHGHEASESVTHHQSSAEMPSRPESFKPQAEA